MADERENELDPGSPHMRPEDYEKAGLGDFEKDPSRAAAHAEKPGPEDERIATEVRNRLSASDTVDASRIQVEVVHGQVRLLGTAENRYLRERAENLVREVEGVQDVLNKIAVQPTEGEQTETGKPILTTQEPGANVTGSTQRS